MEIRRKEKKERYLRKKCGLPPMKNGRKKDDVWSSINWSETSKDIAQKIGKTVQAVNRERRTAAPDTVGIPGRSPKWITLGFKSQRDFINYRNREWRKKNPKRKNRRLRCYIQKWKELGFLDKHEWKAWKKDKKMKTPCKKCGGLNKIVMSRKAICCRDCYNKNCAKRLRETGIGSIKGKKRRIEVKDDYISYILGIPTHIARNHQDLIEAKREQIKILRELKPTKRTKHNAQEPEQPATSPR